MILAYVAWISLSKSLYPSTTDERDRMSKIPYASALGSIMYAMLCTQPDVSYALSVTSRYQSDPDEGHWTAVKTILKVLGYGGSHSCAAEVNNKI